MAVSYVHGMERLVAVVQELSMARELPAIMAIVRRAARDLTGADGATFVLRDGACCYYADEDAIAPLWKGLRFPLERCISGWVMQHREAVAIEDIYQDPRVPTDAYRPTFVKSLAMVPIRRLAPVGAIGNYWASVYRPPEESLRLLQALADSTSIAMENVELLGSLERRVAERTTELEVANRELDAFAAAVSHDLRAPLRAISGFTQAVREDHGAALGDGLAQLDRVTAAATRMGGLIDALLQLARAARGDLLRAEIDVSGLAAEVAAELRAAEPARPREVDIAPGLVGRGDARLVRVVLANLLANAWKFTGRQAAARIEVGAHDGAFYVRDNGVGFDPAYADKLFAPFQRLHAAGDFEGTGIGLATAQRVVHRHGGRIWAESAPGRGATFFFTLAPAA